jgi:hypothetical protein
MYRILIRTFKKAESGFFMDIPHMLGMGTEKKRHPQVEGFERPYARWRRNFHTAWSKS